MVQHIPANYMIPAISKIKGKIIHIDNTLRGFAYFCISNIPKLKFLKSIS